MPESLPAYTNLHIGSSNFLTLVGTIVVFEGVGGVLAWKECMSARMWTCISIPACISILAFYIFVDAESRINTLHALLASGD